MTSTRLTSEVMLRQNEEYILRVPRMISSGLIPVKLSIMSIGTESNPVAKDFSVTVMVGTKTKVYTCADMFSSSAKSLDWAHEDLYRHSCCLRLKNLDTLGHRIATVIEYGTAEPILMYSSDRICAASIGIDLMERISGIGKVTKLNFMSRSTFEVALEPIYTGGWLGGNAVAMKSSGESGTQIVSFDLESPELKSIGFQEHIGYVRPVVDECDTGTVTFVQVFGFPKQTS